MKNTYIYLPPERFSPDGSQPPICAVSGMSEWNEPLNCDRGLLRCLTAGSRLTSCPGVQVVLDWRPWCHSVGDLKPVWMLMWGALFAHRAVGGANVTADWGKDGPVLKWRPARTSHRKKVHPIIWPAGGSRNSSKWLLIEINRNQSISSDAPLWF